MKRKEVVFLFIALISCRREAARPAAVVIGVPYELGTLDPHAEDKLASFAILSNVYDPLVHLDGDMKIRPGLAQSWESPEPNTWVFHLRPSVRFQSGRPLRADDVVYSLRRLLGSSELEFRDYLVNVSEVQRLDGLTVQIRTERPSRIFLNKLSNVFIIPEGADALRESADGTGPYGLESWTKGTSIRLLRNPTYWGGAPPLDKAEYALGRGPEEAIEGLQEGRYQLIQCDSKKAQALLGGSARYTVLRRDNLYVKHLGFDLSRDATPFCSLRPNPFKDRRVRRAIHIGLERHRLVRELWSYAVPATQPVPRFVFGFNPQIQEPTYDREAARALLREAGLAKGFDVVLHARALFRDAATVIQRELAEIGIKVEPRVLPDVEFFNLVGGGGATFWLNRFSCSTGDASDFLDAVVHSRGADRRFGKNNYGGYVSAELDRAIEASTGIEKAEERRDLIQEILQKSMEELIVIPLYNDQDVYAVDRSLSWQPRSDSYIRASEIAPAK